MSDIAIKVEGLGKEYIIGHKKEGDLRNAFGAKINQLFGVNQTTKESFWALKDINFEIKQGEAVGIIGRNGAGKSTLLKVLSRITEPTTGRFEINGRVSSLLEVGTGFHPELSGRENIFLNGTILGMKRAEIKAKFDEILDFSGVEKFIDTPVKHYSSGMKVRLAFSVAAHLEPEILIVDEVLAVGDAEFQKKCLGKMDDVSKNEGRTVVFVSHDMQAVSNLTSFGLLLNEGINVYKGNTADVISTYLQSKYNEHLIYTNNKLVKTPYIKKVTLFTSDVNNNHTFGKSLKVQFILNTPYPLKGASLSFQILNEFDTPILHLWTFDSERKMCREPGEHTITCNIPKFRLYMGNYTLRVYFSEPPGGDMFEKLDYICPFKVNMFSLKREYPFKKHTCTYIDDTNWTINAL